MPEPRLLLNAAMVQRAERAYENGGDMESAIRAAFEGVPLSNFAAWTLLGEFELVVVARRGGVGVFGRNGDPDGFDSLPHRARMTFSRDSRIRGLAVSSIGWSAPVAREDGA